MSAQPDETLIASFMPDGDEWAGAIYALRRGMGPELVLRCVHRHHSMHRASACAAAELAYARRVIELADHYRGVAS